MQVQASSNYSRSPVFDEQLSFVYATAAAGLTIEYVLTASAPGGLDPGAFRVLVYADDGTTLIGSVMSSSPISGTLHVAIPADGNYYVLAIGVATYGAAGASSGFVRLRCSGGPNFKPCPARAAYGPGPSYVNCA